MAHHRLVNRLPYFWIACVQPSSLAPLSEFPQNSGLESKPKACFRRKSACGFAGPVYFVIIPDKYIFCKFLPLNGNGDVFLQDSNWFQRIHIEQLDAAYAAILSRDSC